MSIDRLRTLAAAAGACSVLGSASVPAQAPSKTRFEISVPAAAHAEPITGRVFVIISRTGEREPRLQTARTGVPFFGHDVERFAAGQAATIDSRDLGSPVESLRDIPPGDYFVQAVVNVYSEFKRADGHVVWMHEDQWEGQQWSRSPANLYSTPQRVHLDAAQGYTVKLSASNVMPPITVPADDQWVKRIKMQSPMLTKFWGRPIYIGATILLPRDYETATISYPVNYIQGHFSINPPLGFAPGNDVGKEWTKDDFPRILAVTMQHPTPYFDDSYAVNSVNNGPYNDAIMQELIPEIEKRFRVIKEPYARYLSGGSTGGWEALALQIFNPDFFGGTWAYCPDPVTFSDVEGINIYKDKNAFYKEYEWRREPTINSREINGEIRQTSEQRNHFELASGTKGRSGQQLDVWSSVFGPVGQDGYFEPLFDKRTGVMDPAVAQYWKEHWDLMNYLQKNWPTIGPKLVDKLHIYVGDADNFFLDRAVRELEAWMKTTTNPHYEGFFMYGDQKGHCFAGPGTQLDRMKEMAQFSLRKKPAGATTPWWKY